MSQRKFCLLYASQTGQAQAIAEEVRDTSDIFNLTADLHCLSQIEKEFTLEEEKYFVFIVSTTGDGDPPDTALKFWRHLRKNTLSPTYLQHIRYALLGLGDSNYTNFCNFGKNLNKKLQELGAKPFLEAAFADDGTGLEIVVEPWMESLWESLQEEFEHLADSPDSQISSEKLNLDPCTNVICIDKDQTKNKLDVKDEAVILNTLSSELSVDSLKDSNSSVSVSEESISSKKILSSSSLDQIVETNLNSIDNSKDISNNKGVDSTSCGFDEPNMDSNFDSQGSNNSDNTKKTPDKNTSTNDNSSIVMEKKHDSLLFSSLLSESALTVPLLQPSNLKVTFNSSKKLTVKEAQSLDQSTNPLNKPTTIFAEISSATRLTANDAVKPVLDLRLKFHEEKFDFEPGDSFSIICPNVDKEVNELIERLDLLDEADSLFEIQILDNSKKVSIPQHIPIKSSLQYIFTHCCDIRAVPKKSLIRALVEYTSNSVEKRRLQELCSRQGNEEFAKYIREPGLSIIEILKTFSSCKPPIERILEMLPQLLPRHYSVASSPLISSTEFNFMFTIVELPSASDHQISKQGLCTGWLDEITKHFQKTKAKEDSNLSTDFKQMLLTSKPKIPIFKRPSNNFRLPDDFSIPTIMIGPGTGVAPFIGFLQHREMQKAADADNHFGEMWLFFGCRNKEKDFLYRNELEVFLEKRILSQLFVAFSRDKIHEDGTLEKSYVQDIIIEHSKKFSDMIVNKNATVYVCGDAKNMAKDVQKAIICALKESEGMTEESATDYIKNMQVQKRYVQDIWL